MSWVDFQHLELQNLTMDCADRDSLLEDVNILLPQKSVIRVSGKVGTGKSQILRLFGGLVSAQSGKYFINDVNVNEMSFEEFMPYRLRIGYSFALGGLINNKSLRDNLLLQPQYHAREIKDVTREYVEELIDLFSLNEFADKRPFYVPGGIRKMTVVIRSLILKPDLLILDDPTTGLSPTNKMRLKQLLIEKRKEGFYKYILVASNDSGFLEDFVTHELSIESKKLVINELLPQAVSA